MLFPSGREVIGRCPRCGSDVTGSKKGFFCERSDCKFGLWRDNKFLTAKQITLDTDDLDAHSGVFSVERTEWESVRDTLQPLPDIVAPKQPDAVSYLHDDTAKTQPENYLKNAEMALEDDYGMIDGIINNGPKQTVAEQEERSSILAKLKAPVETTNRTEKHAPKRSAEKEL